MQVVRKGLLTSFKRSDAERRAWNLAKELDEQRDEIKSLRAELDAIKGEKEETPKKRTTKKSSK